jgi:gliding motility-associated-like protein
MLNHIEIESITWYANGTSVGTGPVLSNIEAGVYEAVIISSQGCKGSKTVELLPEINPFNGISRNGDDKNPIFHINCIENFPQNKVKIFNRAGTLVYEAEGYNNIETYFDGKSNKGIAVMGNNLPDGTYFYIIDKRDGSKPLAGYLEVVN